MASDLFNKTLVPIALAIIPLSVFLNTLNNGFTYDDIYVIVNNQSNINKIENISSLISENYFYISKEGSYRPVVTATYFLDQFISGGAPLFFHLTNLLLHLLNVVVFYYFLTIATRNRNISAISTLIYSIHPALTEAVNGISFREDLLVAFFMFTALIFHIKGKTLLSISVYILALLSKELALILPILFLIYDQLFKKSKDYKVYAGLIITTAFYLFVRYHLLYNPDEGLAAWPLALKEKLVAIPTAILYYLKIVLFPTSLSADYLPYKFITSPKLHIVVLSCITLLLLAVYFVKSNNNTARFGLCWFMITLIPVLNLTAIGNPFAERYIYVPAAGFTLFVVSVVWEKRETHVYKRDSLIILTILFFAALTPLRNKIWRTQGALWEDALHKAPQSFRAYQNIADKYINEDKDFNNAKLSLDKALSLKPDSAMTHNNLGAAYALVKEYDKAIREYKLALKLDPSLMKAYLNLSLIYGEIKDYEASRKSIEDALRVDKNNPDIYLHIGVLFGRMGKIETAVENFNKALAMNPRMPEAHYGLGVAYENKKMYQSAAKEFLAELELNPAYYEARLGLARLFFMRGRINEALTEVNAVLKEAPDNARAKEYLAKIQKSKS